MPRSFAQPDEQAEKGGVKIDVVYLGDIKVKRSTYPRGDVFVVPAGHDAWANDETTIVQFDEFDGAARPFGL
ncbi:MAG TPA: hypothetical protein VFU10_03285 [Gaiellaceae bacterium]|nr:hypothetical protein [Gaiellaceae bacterium]